MHIFRSSAPFFMHDVRGVLRKIISELPSLVVLCFSSEPFQSQLSNPWLQNLSRVGVVANIVCAVSKKIIAFPNMLVVAPLEAQTAAPSVRCHLDKAPLTDVASGKITEEGWVENLPSVTAAETIENVAAVVAARRVELKDF
ncbi:hypothetical protein PoB_004401900 [Plakobranchus ocellatus]|uniref:Uncharacterized protein n=1 Tax=Plakobranchus ocellatus TaxID=259542 RepID=A0AAV4BFA4_9GAST|nr:hypothetical protein PoB_004401900 [Plakobranchus ocellatus]